MAVFSMLVLVQLMFLIYVQPSTSFAVGGKTYRGSIRLQQSVQQETEKETTSAKTSRSDADPDVRFMRMALDVAMDQDESGLGLAFPAPTVGAVLVDSDETTVLASAASDCRMEAVRKCLLLAGCDIQLVQNEGDANTSWHVSIANKSPLRDATLYVTLEPSTRRRGTALPSVAELIIRTAAEDDAIGRVVIGASCPVPEKAGRGVRMLEEAGLHVRMGGILEEACQELITEFASLANCKLQRMARNQFAASGRPLGFLHCSVIESDNVEAFARQGNAFGTNFGSTRLSYRDFGSYELAPPPDHLWAEEDDEFEVYDVEFEEEDEAEEDPLATGTTPIMPWYEQADAVVVTFPRFGNGPPDDNSVKARLNGVKWLASQDALLPAGVERVVVMDATELLSLPLSNDDPNVPDGVDVESFWKADHRKPTRVLLRRGVHESSRAAATAASEAAQAAASAAQAAMEAVETGDVTRAAEIAQASQVKAEAAATSIQKELDTIRALRSRLEDMGVVVETLEGREPIHVMNYLGKKNGLYTVVWRAGCWGNRGVNAILAGAFQCVSAHLAVDAIGGQFWQLIIAENAIQAACGPRSQVQVLADDISLEYCDDPSVDTNCNLTMDGDRPVRLVRVDCRVGLVDGSTPGEIIQPKTEKLDRNQLIEQAPWFL